MPIVVVLSVVLEDETIDTVHLAHDLEPDEDGVLSIRDLYDEYSVDPEVGRLLRNRDSAATEFRLGLASALTRDGHTMHLATMASWSLPVRDGDWIFFDFAQRPG